MNVLDFCLVVLLVAVLAFNRSMSLVYYFLCTCGVGGGYLLGIVLAPAVTSGISSDTATGFVSLGLMLGLAAALGFAGHLAGRKVRMRVIPSPIFKADKLLAIPYKVLVSVIALVVLSQTLIYVPLLGLQFVAQGSTLLMPADRLLPATPLEQLAKKIAPDQFNKLSLAYDENPLTFSKIVDAGPFQQVVEAATPSIVKISGRTCTGIGFGSGFVAAPGLVVTNAHVISGASSIYMSDHVGTYPATPVVIDNDHDIAVLYSKFVPGKPLPLASSPTALGSPAATVGYPGGGELRLLRATVYDHPYTSSHNKLNGSNTLTLNATLGHGSSGGPVLNLRGEVIGVNDAGAESDLVAIKADVVRGLLRKAQNRPIPTSVDFCGVAPKFY